MNLSIFRKWLLFIFPAIFFLSESYAQKSVVYSGDTQNDLYQLLIQNGFEVNRFAHPEEAIKAAEEHTAVFIVADAYPDEKVAVTPQLFALAKKKKIRLYVEYPEYIPDVAAPDTIFKATLERGVITSTAFGNALRPMSIVGINGCYLIPVNIGSPLIVLAKVAGFDKAVYGIDDVPSYPVLWWQGDNLIAATQLSDFATGRFEPQASWKQIWEYILSEMTGQKQIKLHHWVSHVSPMYELDEPLPKDVVQTTVRKGVDWFYKGRFFINRDWKDKWLEYQGDGTMPVGPAVDQKLKKGDGSLGILEGHASQINADGSQKYRYWLRADVQGEAAYALAAASDYLNDKRYAQTSDKLSDFLFYRSNFRSGAKNDANSPVYGLIGWSYTHPWVFYGDDNARCMLGMIGASAYLKTDKWDKDILENILANFRTTGVNGFRGDRLEEEDVIKNGWKHYWNGDVINPHPHFESWMWACYLWLYQQTGYSLLLERTKKAIEITMNDYPAKWKWTNGIQQERARMILPLAWLVQLENTPQHREWLDKVVGDLLKNQMTNGAIREELGAGKGLFGRTPSNDAYGKTEAPLIFENGDPVADMLYTSNFAFFSLNEAYHATGNESYKTALDKLADFLVRIQVKSDKYNDIDGAWFRAFDYDLWDYWASNADAGWGAWATLTGWIQSWIVATQVLVARDQSYWNLTRHSTIENYMKDAVSTMFDGEGRTMK